ncbi:MAG: U32 family peptidase [Clostridium sp.]|nr:U32 family peptidase [Clostridium sp.]
MNQPLIPIELLSPARDLETAVAAIDHGADAVYIGAPSHGARAAAANTLDDIRRLTDYAHNFDARIYATVNTLVYDSEIREVERMVTDLWRIGVDALIVQDMSLLRMEIPQIELHASTQCDIRTAERARFLADAGFSQLVLPRELTLEETEAIRRALPADISLEAFVHGALCVSYSGDCQAGFASRGRSANRGECPQICRLPYDLTDLGGNTLVGRRHLLSLRDLNRSASLAAMLRAGISSFKIEGRLKDSGYVRNVTAFYNRLLNRLIDENPGLWCRRSAGTSETTFTPDVNKSFNRGFTSYFTHSPRPGGEGSRMASLESPKWLGEPVGTVRSVSGNVVTARLNTELRNGDGLGYFTPAGVFEGFHLNRVDGNRLLAASRPSQLPPGTVIYRNRDKQSDDAMRGKTASRSIGLRLTLSLTPDHRVVLSGTDERGCSATVISDTPAPDTAKTPQADARRRTLVKTGSTIYRVIEVEDLAGDCFVPLSILSDLRRRLTDLLDQTRRATWRRATRRPENPGTKAPACLTYHDNVANRLAREFYLSHGSESIAPALETAPGPVASGTCVMTTRYCIRRELGECLRDSDPSDRKLPAGDLILRASDTNIRLRVCFDCRDCRMHLLTEPSD